MEFSLYYRGLLKANGNVKHKHHLRQQFHVQLRELWSQVPLNEHGDLIKNPPTGSVSIIQPLKPFEFVPLVSHRIDLVAELSILLLRPEPPGSIITQGGDIDNRLKTLLDSLKAPSRLDELPRGAAPRSNEKPFYCLLADDKLVTKVTVETDRLLDPAARPPEVIALIRITTKATRHSWANTGLA